MQRFFDIIFSLLAIAILFPILLICIVFLKLTGEGEVFYKQLKVRQKQKLFKLIKFATMKKNSEKMGAGTLTLKNDSRVLPFGKFLRKTKINELPQLFNIFLGSMSFVGPRPLAEKQFNHYNESQREKIASIKPGLTGFGSIYFRDEEQILHESSEHNADEIYKKKIAPIKAKLEQKYIEQKNIKTYFIVLFLTFVVVVFPKSNLHIKVLNIDE